MKEKWESPRIKVETFAPNDYVSACWGVACDVDLANAYETSNGFTNVSHRSDHCGNASNQYLQDTNNDGTFDTMTETGTDGLGDLNCVLYTDGSYTTREPYSSVKTGDHIFWTTAASGGRVWHHQGDVFAQSSTHPNRS
ncbi:MAG: hypothetical protein ACI4DT_10015 [Chordicoccus sp.]